MDSHLALNFRSVIETRDVLEAEEVSSLGHIIWPLDIYGKQDNSTFLNM